MMLFFYTVVSGWVYCYVFKALAGSFKGITASGAVNMFNEASVGPLGPIVWQIVALIVAGIILGMGVKSGIEKITKILMPVPVVFSYCLCN